MKVYLVENTVTLEDEDDSLHNLYGVFSSRDKAEKVLNKLKENFKEHSEENEVIITEAVLDETTEDYDFYMNN